MASRLPSGRRSARRMILRAVVVGLVAVVMSPASRGPAALASTPTGADPNSPATPPPAWSATISEYPIATVPGSSEDRLAYIATGSDGNLWVGQFSYTSQGQVSAIDKVTTGGALAAQYIGARAYGITAGPDGALWFTGTAPGVTHFPSISRVTTGGAFSTFPLPGCCSSGPFFQAPQHITTGTDGALWFSDFEGNFVGRLTTTGQLSTYQIGGFNTGGLAAATDGNVWIAEGSPSHKIARITPLGSVTEFTLPARNAVTIGAAKDVTAGPNGSVYFTDYGNNTIDVVASDGSVTAMYVIPTDTSIPTGITTAPDGKVWFTEAGIDRIGRLDPATGAIIEFHVRTIYANPLGITTGPDGKIWFTEAYGPCNKAHCSAASVGSLDPRTIQPPPAPCLTVTANTKLTSDVGPCSGDGIDVVASNVTLDLNGHKVWSGGGARTGDFAGIHLMGVQNASVVTSVRGGQVAGFDAGVFLDHGSGNTVTGLSVHDNIGSEDSNNSLLGDGIVAFHSAGNHITFNTVVHNGIYDGIGLLGLETDNNTVSDNDIEANTDQGHMDPGGGTGILTNAFLEFDNPGRGGSLVGNNILRNVVKNNDNSGISNASNTHALVQGNTVSGNGFRDDDPGNGIGDQNLLTATFDTYMQIVGNTVTGNANEGIEVNSRSNTITNNVSTGNGGYKGASGRYAFDLADRTENPITSQFDCTTNTWFGNTWGSGGYSRPCVTAGGSGPPPPFAGTPFTAADALVTDAGFTRGLHTFSG